MNFIQFFKKTLVLASISLILAGNVLWSIFVTSHLRSPINFSQSMVIQRASDAIQFNYDKHTPLSLDLRGGRTKKGGRRVVLKALQENNLVLQGKSYRLVFIDFKKPSEHTIDWKHFPVELQLVHKNEIDGRMAVVAIFLQQNSRHSVNKQPMLSRLLHVMGGQDARLEDINLMDLYPKDKSYFCYEGSLTVPPYTENVTWIVYQQPIDVAQGQLEQIAQMINGDNNQDVVMLEKDQLILTNSQ